MRSRNVLVCLAAASAAILTTTTASADTPAQARPHVLPPNPVMLVHEVTGTYLEVDDYNDNIGAAVKVWNLDPPRDTPGQRGHIWTLTGKPDGYYLIKTIDNGRCLAASGTSAGDYPRLRNCDGSYFQDWGFRPAGGNNNDYVVAPRIYPNHALAIRNNDQVNDRFVVPTRVWGYPTLSEFWQVTQARASTSDNR